MNNTPVTEEITLYRDTYDMLEQLSKHQAKTFSSIVDELIEQEYYRVFVVPTIRETRK